MNELGSEVPEGMGWGVFHKPGRVNPSWPSCPARSQTLPPTPSQSRSPGMVGTANFPPAGRPLPRLLETPPCQPSFSPLAPAAWRPSAFLSRPLPAKGQSFPGAVGVLDSKDLPAPWLRPHTVNGVQHLHGHNTFLGPHPSSVRSFLL